MKHNMILNVILYLSVVGLLICISSSAYKYMNTTDPTQQAIIKSNREYGPDTNQTFRTAYIKIGDNVKKIKVKSWRDFPGDIGIQFMDEDGIVYLTDYSNVVLTTEDITWDDIK